MHFFSNKISDGSASDLLKTEFDKLTLLFKDIDIFALDKNELHRVNDLIEHDRVVIFFTDTPHDILGISTFHELFNDYPHKKFCMLANFPWMEKISNWPKNVKWIHFNVYPIGNRYKSIDCLLDKNLDSNKIGISLNRLPRTHRLSFLSYLLGSDIDKVCTITAPLLNSKNVNLNQDIMDCVPWEFEGFDSFKHKLLVGWERARNLDGIHPVDLDARYPYKSFDTVNKQYTVDANFINYEISLKNLYKNSFVEFVNFSIYDYAIPWIDEKFFHSQIGCNFPIIVGGTGSVDWLRKNNFDMFDDIINHDYDNIDNPVDRMQTLVDNNKHLLYDFDNTVDLWVANAYRFKYNVKNFFKHCDNVLENGRNSFNQWYSKNE